MEGSRRRSYQARLLTKLQLIKYLNPAQENTLSADVNGKFIPKTLWAWRIDGRIDWAEASAGV